MAERKLGLPAPATDTEVRNADWDGQDLARQQHSRVAFVDVDLTDTASHGAVFSECTFRDCRLNASRHTDTAFVNCTFVRCSFFDAHFDGCKLVGSMFDRCTFGPLHVERGDWSFVGLPGADLRRARFRGVRMREADLTGARFEGARLIDVDLSGAWLHGANLSGCDLRGSDLSALDPTNAELRGAVVGLDQAIVLATNLGLDVRADDPPE